jgi:hypothetical protein
MKVKRRWRPFRDLESSKLRLQKDFVTWPVKVFPSNSFSI